MAALAAHFRWKRGTAWKIFFVCRFLCIWFEGWWDCYTDVLQIRFCRVGLQFDFRASSLNLKTELDFYLHRQRNRKGKKLCVSIILSCLSFTTKMELSSCEIETAACKFVWKRHSKKRQAKLAIIFFAGTSILPTVVATVGRKNGFLKKSLSMKNGSGTKSLRNVCIPQPFRAKMVVLSQWLGR